jgi:hypothetical protein
MSQQFKNFIEITYSAKITEVSFVPAKAPSPILVTVLIHTVHRHDEIMKAIDEVAIDRRATTTTSSNMMLLF